jgi:hypothetical protein
MLYATKDNDYTNYMPKKINLFLSTPESENSHIPLNKL